MHTSITLLAALSLSAPLAVGQTTQVMIDLGGTDFPTAGTVSETWNEVTVSSPSPTLELLDTSGSKTGIEWRLTDGRFRGFNNSGTASPGVETSLGAFPASATRDVLYGQAGETVAIALSGFDPKALVSFTFAASRIGAADVRTTEYVVRGFNGALTALDASGNTARTASVSDILPDASGVIRVTVRAAPDNDNANGYFYLGAVQLDVKTSAKVPSVLGFEQRAVSASAREGAGAVDAELTLRENSGAACRVEFTAIDRATGRAPTWLMIPTTASTGRPITVKFSVSTLPAGTYMAVLRAVAPGRVDSTIGLTLRVRANGALNLLFYGNSYSQYNSGVPALVGFIAQSAGSPPPRIVARLSGGKNLHYHLTNREQADAIRTSLPQGETWDFVIMQGHSVEAAEGIGDPTSFRANAVAILTNVRAHSPGARAVMYQTWARAAGASVYPRTFADPLEMHGVIRASYQRAVDDMNKAFGDGTAFVARAGDAVAARSFAPSLYAKDRSHPTAETTLMASMAIFREVYGVRVMDVEVDFQSESTLVQRLESLGLTSRKWKECAEVVEEVSSPRSVQRSR